MDFSSEKYKEYVEKKINCNKNLSNCYYTNKGELYIFNFFDRRETIDLFLEGKYSKFNEKEKDIILKYFGQRNTDKPCNLVNNKPQQPHHVILYPEYYHELVAEELYEKKDLKTGLMYLKEIQELWEKYDYEIEFLECEIIKTCRNYDNLTQLFNINN